MYEVFRSRVSITLVIIFLLVDAISIFTVVINSDYLHGIIAFVVLNLIFGCALFCIKYTIDDKTLNVKTFPYDKGKSYDLTKLKSVRPTRSILSAPAASLKRIELDFGCGDSLIISPASQDYFIELVRKANPDVSVDF